MNADMKWLDDPEVFRVKIGESIDAVIKWTMGVCF